MKSKSPVPQKDLRSFVPTLSKLLHTPAPALASSDPFEELVGAHRKPIQRALIYCPDAFGLHALKHLPSLEKRLENSSTHTVELQSVFPPVTPVCFATLFTGASPTEHGIRKYEKPVLACDTLFDSLIRAGKKIAIVAVAGSSVDQIFRGRSLDYFSMPYDPLVTMKTHELMKAQEHDVIVAYHQEYDDLLHDTTPFSELALKALERHVESWEFFVRSSREIWKNDFLVAFTPDHGAHIDPKTGRGNHGELLGEQSPEDMNLRHFFYLQ